MPNLGTTASNKRQSRHLNGHMIKRGNSRSYIPNPLRPAFKTLAAGLVGLDQREMIMDPCEHAKEHTKMANRARDDVYSAEIRLRVAKREAMESAEWERQAILNSLMYELDLINA